MECGDVELSGFMDEQLRPEPTMLFDGAHHRRRLASSKSPISNAQA